MITTASKNEEGQEDFPTFFYGATLPHIGFVIAPMHSKKKQLHD